MSLDLINPSIRYTIKRNRIPAFQRLENLLESTHLSQELLQVASEFLGETKESGGHLKDYLDVHLEDNLNDILKGLPKDSFAYQYLALSLDFSRIRSLALELYGGSGERLLDRIEQIGKSLLCKELYFSELKGLIQKIHNFPNAFEWIMAIDRVYLKLLLEFSKDSSEFNQRFVGRKLDTYNVSAWFRLQTFGKKTESLNGYLISNPKGLSLNSLNRTQIEQLVNKVLKTNAIELTPEVVEIAMKLRELQYTRTAVIQGYGEPVVLLYIELLKAFFYDLKLLAIYEQLKSDKEDIRQHLLNYDLK